MSDDYNASKHELRPGGSFLLPVDDCSASVTLKSTHRNNQRTHIESTRFAAPAFEPVADRCIDQFRLIRELGCGGFGRVWLALDERLGRQVAIKFPHQRLGLDSKGTRRFKREAKITAKLNHPNLIPILDAVLDANKAYIVSEYCPGPTLSQWSRGRGYFMEAAHAICIVSQIAKGLQAAHHLGLIHRDIKPSNIIISDPESEYPTARLIDFGMARWMSDVSDFTDTQSGTLVGSVPYMSPEQAAGRINDHGPHSDVYSLGVVLYELLTGVSPFSASCQVQSLHRVLNHQPPSAASLRPQLTKDLSAVCQRCLEKEPRRRYRDAGELLNELERVRRKQPTIARPVGCVGRTLRWSQRNPFVAGLGLLATIAMIFGCVSLTLYAVTQGRYARTSELQAARLRSVLGEAELARQRRRQTSYETDVSLAFLMFNSGRYADARRLLDRQIPAAPHTDPLADLRRLEWALLDRQVRTRYERWGRHDGPAREITVLADRERAASIGDDGAIRFWDIQNGCCVSRLDQFDDQASAIASMPDGRLAVPGPLWPFGSRSTILIDAQSGATTHALHMHPTTIETIRVSKDGKIIASGCRYDGIKVWSTEKKRAVYVPTVHRCESFGLTPDGRYLITGNLNTQTLAVYDTDSGNVVDKADLPNIVPIVQCANSHNWAAYTIRNRKGFGLVGIERAVSESSRAQSSRAQSSRNKSEKLVMSDWIDTDCEPIAFAFSPQDECMAVADSRVGIRWYRLQENQDSPLSCVHSTGAVAVSQSRLTNVAFLNSDDVVTTSLDGSVERFSPGLSQRMPRGQDYFDIFPQPPSIVGGVLLNECQSEVFVLGTDRNLWHAKFPSNSTRHASSSMTTKLGYRSVWKSDAPLATAAISPDDSTLAIVDRDERLHWLSDWRTGTPKVQVLQLPVCGGDSQFDMCEFSASGRYLGMAGSSDHTLVFDQLRSHLEPIIVRTPSSKVKCIAFSRDERYFASAGGHGIEIVDLESNEPLYWNEKLGMPLCLEFTPDGNTLAVGWEDGSVSLLTLSNREHQFLYNPMIPQHYEPGRPVKIEFVNSDRMLMISDNGLIQFWDCNTRLAIGCLPLSDQPSSECNQVSIRDHGNRVVFAGQQDGHSFILRWSLSDEKFNVEYQ
ncbi:Serine/threonine-protein kinase PknB [Novipirellula aureliae]|uniref:Serine/threonine-protein kinase PknB n=1 Tax=Novipirellula aureliae TaxID=2527966 RepID=A0A5C6DVN4_9BACT|nr:protein kinase [Novipirellula aureliae]TWU40294.1 Serine/threonine-protein kinase PknB [Novipirellula aureliae]